MSAVLVGVRARPLLNRELGGNECLSYNSNQVFIGTRSFSYDYVFNSNTSQDEVYTSAISPMLTPCLEGYNVTIMAYGQTGSGKTYTMGSMQQVCDIGEDNVGIIPRFINNVFEKLEKAKSTHDISLSMSLLEIYNEELVDLLSTNNVIGGGKKNSLLQIVEDPKEGIIVNGLSKVEVHSANDVMNEMKRGASNRTTASTMMNDVSSRSHMVLTVYLRQELLISQENDLLNENQDKNVDEERVEGGKSKSPIFCPSISSKITFVDLAGSERLKKTGAAGDRMKEGININQGLLTLGTVINALADEERLKRGEKVFVPYRDSKLTRLLQEALGGNSRTFFLACVSPSDINADETLSTLRYAHRARNIKNNAVINRDHHSEGVMRLKKQIQVFQFNLVRSLFASTMNNRLINYEDNEEEIALLMNNVEVRDYILNQLKLSTHVEHLSPSLLLAHKLSNTEIPPPPPLNSISTNINIPPFPTASKEVVIQNNGISSIIERKNLGEVPYTSFDDDIVALETLLAIEKSEKDFAISENETKEEIDNYDIQITQKEKLLSTLKNSLAHYHQLREGYETMVIEVKRLEGERDKLSTHIASSTNVGGDNSTPNGKSIEKLKSLKEQIEKMKRNQQGSLRVLRVAERDARKVHTLEEEIQKLKISKVTLQKKFKNEVSNYIQYQNDKKIELSILQKKHDKKEILIEKLKKTTSIQSNIIGRRANVINTIQKKLKETESKLLNLLTRKRQISIRRASKSKDMLLAGANLPNNNAHSMEVETKKFLLDLQIDRKVQLIESENILASELSTRASLLTELIGLVECRKQLLTDIDFMKNNAVVEEDDISNQSIETLVDNLEDVETKIEQVEGKINLCESIIVESQTILENKSEKEMIEKLSELEKNVIKNIAINDQDRLEGEFIEKILLSLSENEAKQIAKLLVDEIVESKANNRLSSQKTRSVEATLDDCKKENKNLKNQLKKAVNNFEMEATKLQDQYENDMLLFIKQSALKEKEEERDVILNEKENDRKLFIENQILKKKLCQMETEMLALVEKNEERMSKTVKEETLFKEVLMNKSYRSDDHLLLEFQILWNEIGTESEEREKLLHSLSVAFTDRQDVILKQLRGERDSLVETINEMNIDMITMNKLLGDEDVIKDGEENNKISFMFNDVEDIAASTSQTSSLKQSYQVIKKKLDAINSILNDRIHEVRKLNDKGKELVRTMVIDVCDFPVGLVELFRIHKEESVFDDLSNSPTWLTPSKLKKGNSNNINNKLNKSIEDEGSLSSSKIDLYRTGVNFLINLKAERMAKVCNLNNKINQLVTDLQVDKESIIQWTSEYFLVTQSGDNGESCFNKALLEQVVVILFSSSSENNSGTTLLYLDATSINHFEMVESALVLVKEQRVSALNALRELLMYNSTYLPASVINNLQSEITCSLEDLLIMEKNIFNIMKIHDETIQIRKDFLCKIVEGLLIVFDDINVITNWFNQGEQDALLEAEERLNILFNSCTAFSKSYSNSLLSCFAVTSLDLLNLLGKQSILCSLEKEIEYQQGRVNLLQDILLLIDNVDQMEQKMTEFEKNQCDKNRFKGSSLKFLKEEKQRKHYAVQYPILLDSLKEKGKCWEAKEERELKLGGIRILHVLEREMNLRKENSELLKLKLKINGDERSLLSILKGSIK